MPPTYVSGDTPEDGEVGIYALIHPLPCHGFESNPAFPDRRVFLLSLNSTDGIRSCQSIFDFFNRITGGLNLINFSLA